MKVVFREPPRRRSQIRVCMLLRSSFSRDGRVLREARSLAGAGYDVTILALRTHDLPARESRDGFRVVRPVRAGAVAGPTIAGNLPGGWGRTLPRLRSAVWARDLLIARRMKKAALEVPADVYHAHDLNTLGPALEAARARGARLVYDAHELWPDLTGLGRGERARWRKMEQRLIHEADAVIVPSKLRGEELVRRYGIEMPFVVMNCPPAPAVSPDPAKSPLAQLRRGSETLLVYAGGFTPNRGLENVIRAMDLLDGCRLVMLGWGPLEDSLRSLASDRVVFMDPVDPDDVVSTLAGADVGLAPYLPIGRNNELAAPNKLFEYLHAGLAVAGSNLPDIRNVVEGHDIGVLFDASNHQSIAASISRLCPRLDQLRERVRAVAPRFSWGRAEQVLLEAYGSLERL